MKKLIRWVGFLALPLLFLAGCASTPADYPEKIDRQATAQASWKVNEVVVEGNDAVEGLPIVRKFLGVTVNGHYMVQEVFVETGKPHTTPFILTAESEVANTLLNPTSHEGIYIQFFSNGQKNMEIVYENGRLISYKSWNQSGVQTSR